MRLILLAGAISLLTSCMSMQQKLRPNSKIVVSTTDQEAISKIAKGLARGGYVIKSVDPKIGLLSTDVKQHSIPRSVLKIDDLGRTSVQALSSPSGVKIQVIHECRYTSANFAAPVQSRYQDAEFSVCTENDYDANNVIPGIDAEIERLAKASLAQKK